MVNWYAPKILLDAGIKAVLSAVFGAYADNRELQAALKSQTFFDYSGGEEIWIDYIADLGDGFDSTYTMARLLAEPGLSVRFETGEPVDTKRGEVLVMGGDQIYPTATREEYENRMVGPYQAALPHVPDEESAPNLFLIPGNHDWYDGLTSFSRLFLQRRWVGGWKTRQSRSYYALKLPHGWWLWGIDVQLGSDIDSEQLDYFKEIASNPGTMKQGSKVVLCTAEPSWVYAKIKHPEADRNLRWFEKNYITKYGHDVAVGLAGDLHCYAHYRLKKDTHRFICGGGGAYLYPTHDLPESLDRTADIGAGGQAEAAPHFFPSRGTSRWLAVRSLLFPMLNRGNFKFSMFLGSFYLLFSWIIQSVSVNKVGGACDNTFLHKISEAGYLAVFPESWEILAHSPGGIFMLLLLIVGLYAYADAKNPFAKLVMGIVHAVAQVFLLAWLVWMIADFNLNIMPLKVGEPLQVLLFVSLTTTVGGFFGGMLMGLYLFVANLMGRHANEVLLCQSIADYKNFIRMHIDQNGKLTLYPVGVEKVCRKWKLKTSAENGEAWFEPKEGGIGDLAHLIEDPIPVGPVSGGAHTTLLEDALTE